MNLSRNVRHKIFSKEAVVPIVLIVAIFIFDRLSKIWIINHQEQNSTIFINKFLNFELIWNTGIGFGLFSTDPNLFYNLTSLFIFLVVLFLFYLIFRSNFFDKICFSIVLGGALGNLYDRIVYFAVPDFIDFHVGDFHWFTFNIADIFITVGIILLIIKDLFFKKNEV
ncbi:MAG: signal peptidase II [Pelagibacteraceae bacterium]